MRHVVLLGLCFVLVSCSRSNSTSVVEVTPSVISETELPTTVSIRGQGLVQTVSLSLDDKQRAAVTEPIVALGETEVAVVGHSVPEELQVWVEGLAPGSYDLRIGSGTNQTVIREAFKVLGIESTDDGTDLVVTNGDASVATSGGDDTLTGSNPNVGEDPGSGASEAALSSALATNSTNSLASSTREGSLDAGNEAASVSPISSDDAASIAASVNSPDTTTVGSSEATLAAEAGACVDSTRLFFDDFESGDFDAWTSYDTTGSCQTSGIESDAAVSGSQAFEANITCSGSDHENYGALQFNGDAVRGSFSNSGLGIDAPFGVVIDFWARAQFDFGVDDGEWLAFLLLSGTCDWTDTVFSVGTGNATSFLAISHVDSGDVSPFDAAESFPQDTWTKVTAYVNYHTGNFILWQNGAPVTQATFVRPGTTLCHVRIGAYISGDTDDARVLVDDPTIWKLNADLGSLDAAPCMAEN